MPRGENQTPTRDVLNHIASLSVVSAPDQVSLADVRRLLAAGYIRQVWINNYALTPTGEAARKGK